MNNVQKLQKKNWRSSRAGERKTRGAAQGCVETFGAAVPDTGGWLCVHPGVETFWSRIEV